AATDTHRRGGQVADLRGVGVADRPFAGPDRRHDARGPVGALPTSGAFVPDLDAAPGPDGGRRLGEVVGEVGRGARLVGAVHRVDGQIGKVDTGVVGGDLRIVP